MGSHTSLPQWGNIGKCTRSGFVTQRHIYIYIYISILRFLAQGKGLTGGISSAFELSGLSVLWLLRTAQNRPGRAQGRSELLRIAQSAPRAAQSRPERSLRVAQSAPRAAPSEEPLRIARSVPRAAQSRSELLEKPIGELGVTCTLHIRSQFYFTWFPLLRACICTGSR